MMRLGSWSWDGRNKLASNNENLILISLILLFLFQRNLMYHPDENNYFGDKLEVEIE